MTVDEGEAASEVTLWTDYPQAWVGMEKLWIDWKPSWVDIAAEANEQWGLNHVSSGSVCQCTLQNWIKVEYENVWALVPKDGLMRSLVIGVHEVKGYVIMLDIVQSKHQDRTLLAIIEPKTMFCEKPIGS